MSMKAGPSTHAQALAAKRRPESDPPTRVDGGCVVCGRPRPAEAIAHDDPFDSTECCRSFYGCAPSRKVA